MSVVEQKKESIRVALQELESLTSPLSAYEAMKTLHQTVCRGFRDDDDGSTIGEFVGDDDFKEEIFSARVIQVVMDMSQDKKAYPPDFYRSACFVICFLCRNNTELATIFVANGGVAFLLECLEAFSSDQFLLITCFAVYKAVIENLNDNASAAFVGITLGKLVDVFQLNSGTQEAYFYQHYCFAVASSFGPVEMNNILYQRIVSHVWHGVIKHKHDEEAQDIGRRLLRHLVGQEAAMKMIDHAEMRHCEDDECAGCA